MTIIRWILGKLILFFDAIFSPRPIIRNKSDQARIERAVANFSLYQYEACPFCVKVRRFLRRENVEISYRDAKLEPYRSELLANGGKLQVPCLRIDDSSNNTKWLYESSDIISYLKNIIGSDPTSPQA